MTTAAELPMPPAVPLSRRRLLREIRNFHTSPALFRDLVGPVARVELGPRWITPAFVVTTSPRGAHDVLTPPETITSKQTSVVRQQRKLSGDNLFNLPHDEWLPRRKAMQPLFTKEHVKEYGGHTASVATRLLADWNGTVVDIDGAMRRLTMTVLGQSVLGIDLETRTETIAAALEHAVRYTTDRALRPVRAPVWLPTPARQRMRRSLRIRSDLTEEALAACAADPDHNAPLIRKLLGTTDPDTNAPLTREVVAAELGAFLFAGHDTTSTTLTYALWQLGRHPLLQERIAAEVGAIGDRPLDSDDVARLGYTVQVLHEVLRLCPPAAAIGRIALEDLVVDGYRVPSGALLIVGVYAMHRDPALWPDAEHFDPDRFGPDGAKPDRWQYLPFGGGRRSCIGDHFAMLEATLGLATIIRAVEITSLDDDFPLAVPFTMVAGGPIRARVRARR